MKNTARQEIVSTSHPPSTGPIAAVMALKPDQVPMARPRSSSANELLMIARLPGTRNAAPIPWTARAAISCPMLEANPQAAEATAKIATPITKILRRP